MRAGTYTPIAVVGLGGGLGATVLRRVWAGAFAGVLQSALWPKAPKAFATSIYLALGWTILPYAKQVHPRLKGINAASTMQTLCRTSALCVLCCSAEDLTVVICGADG